MIFMIQQFSKDSKKKILKLKDKKERLEKTKQKKTSRTVQYHN